MKKIILASFIALLAVSCGKQAAVQPAPNNSNSEQTPAPSGLVYTNSKYGFTFNLPDSWKGYKIVTQTWTGTKMTDTKGEVTVATGSELLIRHPLWISAKPRQDIPIMVFTIAQWDSMQKGDFHIGAAPINPSELGRNSRYVFALPARYNYAFPTGYEEVDSIIQSKPLKAF